MERILLTGTDICMLFLDKCLGIDCSGNGECEIVNAKAKCKCYDRYDGENCEIGKLILFN